MISLSTTTEILAAMGEAGLRLDHLGAVEAGAGNISFSTNADVDLSSYLPDATPNTPLPWKVPALAGRTVFVTGSGCRLRDIAAHPHRNVSAFIVDQGGETGTWYTHPNRTFAKPTSEFNSHLGVHNDQIEQRRVDQLSVIHAQSPYLVQLSHDKETRNTAAFNRAIMRWEPETIVQVPAGIEVLDFMVPGSQELMENNVRALRDRIIVLWAKHGIMVRADESPIHAVDKVEYLETGAMYELRNRMDGRGEGLTDDEIRRVIREFDVKTTLY